MKTPSPEAPSNRVLASLSPKDAARLSPSLKTVYLKKGHMIFDVGDEIEHVYFPHSGVISLLSVMRNGDSVEMAAVGREGVVSAMADVGLQISLTRAVVQAPLVASRIAVAPFRTALDASEVLRNLVVRWNEVLLAQVFVTAACNALHPIEARIARRLLQAGDRTDDDVIPLTQQFLSEILAVRRSSVSEIAGRLLAGGVIRYRRGTIEIVDRSRLLGAACECYQSILEAYARLGSADGRGNAF